MIIERLLIVCNNYSPGTLKGIGSMKKISSASRFPLYQYLSCNPHSKFKAAHLFIDLCDDFQRIFWTSMIFVLVFWPRSYGRKSSWDKANICYPTTNRGFPPSPVNCISVGCVETHSNPPSHHLQMRFCYTGDMILPQSQGFPDFGPDCCSLLPWLHIQSRLLQLAPVAAHSVQIVAACSRGCTFGRDCCSLLPWLHIWSGLLQLAPVAAHSLDAISSTPSRRGRKLFPIQELVPYIYTIPELCHHFSCWSSSLWYKVIIYKVTEKAGEVLLEVAHDIARVVSNLFQYTMYGINKIHSITIGWSVDNPNNQHIIHTIDLNKYTFNMVTHHSKFWHFTIHHFITYK